MSSAVKVDKIWPRLFTTSYIEMLDGEVRIFPKLKVDHISEFTPGHGVVIDDLKLDLSIYVDTIHNQTIDGIKTFVKIPVLPGISPTSDNHAVRKKYVDDLMGGDPEAPQIPGSFPVGGLLSYAGDWNIMPDGFLLCDGASYNRNEYPALFAVIGTWYTYSQTERAGSTFRVPDLRTRVPAGLKPADSNFGTLGRSGGASTHTLSESEMPAHTHDIDAPRAEPSSTHKAGNGQEKSYVHWSGFSALAQSKGQGIPHNNLPPYLVINWIIRYI